MLSSLDFILDRICCRCLSIKLISAVEPEDKPLNPTADSEATPTPQQPPNNQIAERNLSPPTAVKRRFSADNSPDSASENSTVKQPRKTVPGEQF